MQHYRPDRFSAAYLHFKGAAVWEWLHQPDILIVLETASVLRRPAVEGLSPHLKKAFPDLVTCLKFRQMVGHMVRQVMDGQGYALHRSNVRIPQSASIYGYGNVYRIPQAA
ncbi:hypothetical protein [Amylibacter sp. IMCC11727]|uniref:hypothetical protein n=1 Tax=Amylibacter sp. IMCC11727 TaxID=3039851 RepID=UPI00244DF892|nr:hypothetical protein [Amylibacter sp. IMCC11727]WGI22431.1 hypothetical protein QBD29_03160 [Amylibacter sp. IMCC11727]